MEITKGNCTFLALVHSFCIAILLTIAIDVSQLESGYFPMSVLSVNWQSGCWSAWDVHQIEAVLQHDSIHEFMTSEGRTPTA